MSHQAQWAEGFTDRVHVSFRFAQTGIEGRTGPGTPPGTVKHCTRKPSPDNVRTGLGESGLRDANPGTYALRGRQRSALAREAAALAGKAYDDPGKLREEKAACSGTAPPEQAADGERPSWDPFPRGPALLHLQPAARGLPARARHARGSLEAPVQVRRRPLPLVSARPGRAALDEFERAVGPHRDSPHTLVPPPTTGGSPAVSTAANG